MPLPFRVLTDGLSHFFGFHDLIPWDPHDRKLLALQTNVTEDHVPRAGEAAQVAVIDDASGAVEVVAETTAWNWQQGARQHWLPDGRIAFNHAPDGRAVACILDLDTGTSRYLDFTLSDTSADGTFGVSVDFHRLARSYAAYGYATKRPESLPADQDGLFHVDLASGKRELFLSLAEVSRRNFGEVDEATDFLTHASISPSGKRVCLLHRRATPAGAMTTNLIVMDLATGEWRTIADDRVSHFDWEGDDHIVVWCRQNAMAGKVKRVRVPGLIKVIHAVSKRVTGKWIRRRMYGESFRRIHVENRKSEPFAQGVLDEDGHPMIHPVHNHIWVNDTYPNKDFEQTLMLYDASRSERSDLISLKTPASIAGTDWRCDFHPRWNRDGTRICFDSAHLGRRQLCVMGVAEEVRGFV